MKVSASLVISFYNKIEYLRMILAALERQSFKNFEVVIADDGSRPEVVEEIRLIQTRSPLSIQHIWHEDLGFRKTKILNECIRKSKSDYLIFIDGDCIPHYKFIEEHFKNRKENFLLAGRRVNLSAKLSTTLTADKIRSGFLERGFTWKLIADGIFGTTNHVMKGLYFNNNFVQKFLNRKVKGVLGCNFSLHKNTLLSINGFDERYLAPAVGEDTDLEVRLIWNNVQIKMVKNMAVQYHIYHPKLNRSQVNLALFEEVKKQKKAFTPFGIDRSQTPGSE
jgi:glycosyltransferase involved in cell wall biosynthesis